MLAASNTVKVFLAVLATQIAVCAGQGDVGSVKLSGPKKIPVGKCKTYKAVAKGTPRAADQVYRVNFEAYDEDVLVDDFLNLSMRRDGVGENGAFTETWEFEVCCDADGYVEGTGESTAELYVRASGFRVLSPTWVKSNVITVKCVPPGADGDPHFDTWAAQRYSYHGQCDLVLFQSDSFANGLGLDVHIRTEIERFYSMIAQVAIKIGEHVLEVQHDNFFIDGVLGDAAMLPTTFSGYNLSREVQDKSYRSSFTIDVGDKHYIKIRIYKHFMSVSLIGDPKELQDSRGMLGRYSDGALVARDGVTVIEDPNEFGAEWQVRDTEPKLFVVDRHPQFPDRCFLPDPSIATKRRLRTDPNLIQQAETACEDAIDVETCLFDVLATGDIGMADASSF
ncbi:hypothetical protein ACA910_005370 [Epithemia clementina (nom. ined.)]